MKNEMETTILVFSSLYIGFRVLGFRVQGVKVLALGSKV